MINKFILRFKHYVFKRSKDPNLYKFYKLVKSISLRKLRKRKVNDLRNSKIASRFKGLGEYIDSMDKMIINIKSKDLIDNHFYYDIEKRYKYLDDWLSSAGIDPFSAYNAHILIRSRIVILIDEIYQYIDNPEYFNYYKRINYIHFQELSQWINIIEDSGE